MAMALHADPQRKHSSPYKLDLDVLNTFYYLHRRQRRIDQGIEHHQSILRYWSVRVGGYTYESEQQLQKLYAQRNRNAKRIGVMELPVVR